MDLTQIILRMDELKEELDKLRPLSEDRLNRLRQKLKLEWNFHSNSMEGNTLTKSETKSFLLYGVTAKGKPFRHYLEMKGHNEALNKLFKIVGKDLNITESLIKDFHKMILVEEGSDENAEIVPGEWKKLPNYILTGTGERIDFAPPGEVSNMMSDLINWLNNHLSPPKRKKKKYDLHPLLIASGFHIQFIHIHPFGDGNGRMARILVNLILMRCGYVPAVIDLKDRDEYYGSLNVTNVDNPEELARVIGLAEIKSLELALKAAKGEGIEESDDFEKELELLNRKLEAKAKDTPLRSEKRIIEILENDALLFFRKINISLSKFDVFFTSVSKSLNIGSERLEVTDDLPEINWSEKIDKQFYRVELSYKFNDLKNLSSENNLNCYFYYEFHRAHYFVFDNVNEIKNEFKYNQSVDSEAQTKWANKIQKKLLEQINRDLEKD